LLYLHTTTTTTTTPTAAAAAKVFSRYFHFPFQFSFHKLLCIHQSSYQTTPHFCFVFFFGTDGIVK
jgi:hypothetical protein